MSKRRVERDIAEVSEDVLGDLEPDERLQLWIEAAAAGKDAWLDRLAETAPVHTYRATELAYTDRGKWTLQFLQHCIYNLHTGALHYEFLKYRQDAKMVINFQQEGEASEEEIDRAQERADRVKDAYLDLYTCYHASRRFASEILGVEFETWAGLHPDGQVLIEAVEQLLEYSHHHEGAEELLNAEIADEHPAAEGSGSEDDWVTLDDLAEIRFEGMAAAWEDIIATLPLPRSVG